MSLYDNLEKGLLEAIAIEKGNIPLTQRENMPAPSFYAADKEKELIEQLVELRKEHNITQNQLAQMTGYKQQTISRFEKRENSPSLKFFYSLLHALGYDLKIVKL